MHLYFVGGLGTKIKTIKVAAVFVNDGIVADGREFYIILIVVGNFGGLSRGVVVGKKIHGAVAVGEEINNVVVPHRENILCRVVGDVGGGFGIKIINPHIVGHAAAVVFPGSEFAKHLVVGQFIAIRREAAKATCRQWKLCGETSVYVYFEKLAYKIIEGFFARTINDGVVVAPGHHDVVGTHSVRHVVAAEGSRVGNSLRLATFGRDGVNFGVAVVLAGKRNGFAVGRKTRKQLQPLIVGEPAGNAALCIHGV